MYFRDFAKFSPLAGGESDYPQSLLVRFATCLFLLSLSPLVSSSEASFVGDVSYQSRGFIEDSLFPDQLDDQQNSVALSLELQWQSTDRLDQVRLTPYFRYDFDDDERSLVDVGEAYWRHLGSSTELLIGVNKVFWGVAESRHLVSVINQVDTTQDTDGEDYLGQLMMQYSRDTEFGRIEIFAMSGFREMPFAGESGRLRGPLVVDTDDAQYEDGAHRWMPELAVRYSHYMGSVDVGVHVFHGVGREPRFELASSGIALVPYYSPISQVGVDLQLTTEAWLWKFEALVREGQGSTFSAFVGGFEYSFYQIASTAIDFGAIVEVLYDDRDDDVFPTIYNKDVFIGGRFAFNDVKDTSLLVGFLNDLDDGFTGWRIEAERRVGENYTVAFESQLFKEKSLTNPASAFQNDDFVSLTVTRYF